MKFLDTLKKAWLEVEEESTKDEEFKEAWQSLQVFRETTEHGNL